ncbi:uncharacterized protein F5891DRAFT_1025169, partial [Suillus fuscotomentosus]
MRVTRRRVAITVSALSSGCGLRDSEAYVVPVMAECRRRVCTLRAHINDVMKTNSLLVFSFLPPQQQISIIMSINGVLVNVRDPDFVLGTHRDGVHTKVEGQAFNQTDNQRWTSRYTYVKETDTRLWSVQNKDTGDCLSWNSDKQVIMSETEHWWKLVFVGDNVAFQIPHDSKDDQSVYTLKLEDNGSVTIEDQQEPLIKRQLWMIQD